MKKLLFRVLVFSLIAPFLILSCEDGTGTNGSSGDDDSATVTELVNFTDSVKECAPDIDEVGGSSGGAVSRIASGGDWDTDWHPDREFSVLMCLLNSESGWESIYGPPQAMDSKLEMVSHLYDQIDFTATGTQTATADDMEITVDMGAGDTTVYCDADITVGIAEVSGSSITLGIIDKTFDASLVKCYTFTGTVAMDPSLDGLNNGSPSYEDTINDSFYYGVNGSMEYVAYCEQNVEMGYNDENQNQKDSAVAYGQRNVDTKDFEISMCCLADKDGDEVIDLADDDFVCTYNFAGNYGTDSFTASLCTNAGGDPQIVMARENGGDYAIRIKSTSFETNNDYYAILSYDDIYISPDSVTEWPKAVTELSSETDTLKKYLDSSDADFVGWTVAMPSAVTEFTLTIE